VTIYIVYYDNGCDYWRELSYHLSEKGAKQHLLEIPKEDHVDDGGHEHPYYHIVKQEVLP
jgi:hypothetical protein